MNEPLLITIPPSHYCEKARWALDLAGVAYREEGHAPMLHWLYVLPRTRTRTVPVLLREGAPALLSSGEIVRYASALLPPERDLYPSQVRGQVEALEQRFDDVLGPATRRLGYCYVSRSKALFLAFVTELDGLELALVERGERVMRGALARAFKVSERARDRTRARVLEEFAEAERLLADGRPFLTGDRFTAADLTFAALAAPVLVPGRSIGEIAELCPDFAALVAELRGTRGGEHALALTREHHRAARLRPQPASART